MPLERFHGAYYIQGMIDNALSRFPTPASSPLIYLSPQFIQAKEYLEAIVASTSDAICTTDMRGRIIYFSPGAEKMFGRSSDDAVGMPVGAFYEGGAAEARRIMRLLLGRGSLSDHETAVLTPRGVRVHISMSASLLKNRHGKVMGTLGISKDIGRRIELERRLRELSITDNLTGLYNQRHFLERIEAEVKRARRQRQKLSLLVIDLDHFKRANDLWGHLEGDRILRETAGILRKSIRQGIDEGYRYGGDEFTVILPGMGQRVAQRVAQRIREAAALKSYSRVVSLSIGFSSLRGSERVCDLIRRADERMYRAKFQNR